MADLEISALFNKWYLENNSTIIVLLNHNNDISGALYLDTIYSCSREITVLKTEKTQEKYYIYINGLAVYFSNYKKLSN